MQVTQMADGANPESTIRAELLVNGGKVELNDFVQSFIGQAVIGMVRSLRGVGSIREIRLEISKSPE
jgi:hypothetical protein